MRKVAAVCLLLLALACLGARAETEREAYVVSTDDGMPMVVGRNGELIYPSGQFTSIYDLLYGDEGTQLFAVSDGKHTVTDIRLGKRAGSAGGRAGQRVHGYALFAVELLPRIG